jgi:uncharacterized membrane protein
MMFLRSRLRPEEGVMLPDPLHPAVVHLPLALAVLMPPLALLAWLALRRDWLPHRAWLAVVLLQAALAGGGWLALETGEEEEERVERVVAERFIEEHEERAERFALAAGVVLAVAAVGLLGGPVGRAARVLTGPAGLGVLALALGVGHSGGELVYRHGAARAYVTSAPDPEATGGGGATRRDE